jgi:hypothetical protein
MGGMWLSSPAARHPLSRHPSRRFGLFLIGAGALAVVGAGCGSSSHTSTPTSGPTQATAPVGTATPATTASSSATTAAPAGHQVVTVTPSTGLTSGQKVLVTATGFTPNESSLVITECANKGSATGEGDCNLTGAGFVSANGQGDVSTQFAVILGPFGTNKVTCSTAQPCEISVSQESLDPTQQGDTNISFSG